MKFVVIFYCNSALDPIVLCYFKKVAEEAVILTCKTVLFFINVIKDI